MKKKKKTKTTIQTFIIIVKTWIKKKEKKGINYLNLKITLKIQLKVARNVF